MNLLAIRTDASHLGAGKTTLLDCLATRCTTGVLTGEMLVDGKTRDSSFQRKTGYVQQQDLHLSTSTVREALNFSALLRQPAHLSKADKLTYVDQVIKLLDMEAYVDAVVGVPGEGLNVEQRKRLTIGVELAAKVSVFYAQRSDLTKARTQPQLLLFGANACLKFQGSCYLQVFGRAIFRPRQSDLLGYPGPTREAD